VCERERDEERARKAIKWNNFGAAFRLEIIKIFANPESV
jgi:hypothetical protein